MANITFSFVGGVNDSIFGVSQAPIRAVIEHKAEALEQQSMLDKIFVKGTSKHAMEKYTSLTEMQGPEPVGEGGEPPEDNLQEGFDKTHEHMVWKDRFHFTREAMDDDRIIDLRKKPIQFVRGFYRTKERFGAHMLGGALQGSSVGFGKMARKFDVTGMDGKPFFSKDHPLYSSPKKTQSNLFAGDLTAANLGKLETRMQNFTGEGGEALDIAPKTILIPNDATLKLKALEAIGSDKDPTVAGSNGFNYQYGRWNLIVWPYLNFLIDAGLKPWFLIDPDYNEENDCAVLLQRVPLEITSSFDSVNTFNLWNGYERYLIGFNDFRGFAVGGIEGGTTL